MSLLGRLSEGVRAMASDSKPSRYAAADKTITCSHCGNDTFVQRRIFVHGPMAHCLTCTRCALGAWFELAPEPRPA